MEELFTERLVLRTLEPGDAAAMETLIAEKEIASTTLNIPHPYPAGAAVKFIERRQEVIAKGEGCSFAVMDAANQVFMGVVGLHINNIHRHAELAYWIGKPYWGKGYCTEAAQRVLHFAFHELNLNRVWAAAMTRNPASSQVMKKIGMEYEGTFHQHIMKWGQYEDLDYYGILRSDYKK
ncbi:GNAT family N-acetyltransferase [Neobacillus mesonae]|nr:GNAT family N-acetyltransferase [Neobacillus mesonae]